MIPELFNEKEQVLSLEVFPPKKEDEFENAYQTLQGMAKLPIDFISVTYGAGGSRFGKTIEIASFIQNTLGLPALAHLTCVGNQKKDILNVVDSLKREGITNILALRGDRPAYMSDEQFSSRDFFYASDLIHFLKNEGDFRLAGACYPEKHYEAPSFSADLENLKKKQDEGCEFFISQLFFDNDYFYRFLEQASKSGITVPICAGIMPITTAKQLGTTVSLSGSVIPKALSDLIATYSDRPEDMRKAGIDFAIRQILELRSKGAGNIHLYSMNKLKTTTEIVSALT